MESAFLLLAAIMLGVAVFTIVYKIQSQSDQSKAEERLADWSVHENSKHLPVYIKLTKPFLKGYKLDLASGMWDEHRLLEWKKKIITAGMTKYMSAEQFVASKFWLTLFVALFMLLAVAFGEKPPSPIFILGVIVTAFFYPNLHLDAAKKTRQLEIRLALPSVVDLLTLCTEAGLDFMGSIGKIVERSKPDALIEELSQLMKDTQLGKTRSEALRDLANRVDIPETTSLAAVLISSDKMGASIGAVLRAQSDTMRNERFMRAEKMGAEASQKIILPLVLFIMPAVFLIIFGPIIIGFIGG